MVFKNPATLACPGKNALVSWATSCPEGIGTDEKVPPIAEAAIKHPPLWEASLDSDPGLNSSPNALVK